MQLDKEETIVLDFGSNLTTNVVLPSTLTGGELRLHSYMVNNCNSPLPILSIDMIPNDQIWYQNGNGINGVPLLCSGNNDATTVVLETPNISQHRLSTLPTGQRSFTARITSQDQALVTFTRVVVILKMTPKTANPTLPYMTPSEIYKFNHAMEAIRSHN